MNQKYICVTGASSGIGQALAMYYRDEREYTLILSARNQKSKQEMQDIFPLAEIYIANFCLQGAGKVFSENIKGKNIVYCILAAGTGKYGNFHDMESSDISQQMQVNFVSPLELIHNCLREFLKNNTKIIYFSSIASDMPIKNLSVYGASKRSMNYALKILGLEYPSLRILNLHLGAIKTPMHVSSGMGEMKGRELKDVTQKLIKAMSYQHGNKWIYLDWWMATYAIGPCISLFNTLNTIGKKF